jgi:hypothetical protein
LGKAGKKIIRTDRKTPIKWIRKKREESSI